MSEFPKNASMLAYNYIFIQQQVNINPVTGQPDYSQQWIDYYRSLGLMREAEAVEQQAKQQQQQCMIFFTLTCPPCVPS